MKESNDQTITEEDFNKFIKQWDEIAARYPLVLEDRARFMKLSQDKTFVKENNDMYIEASFFTILAPEFAQKISPAELTLHLKKLEEFAERWKTRPTSCWLFDQEIEGLKERMEKLFDLISKYQTIKVYPWTTKTEVKQKFDETRKIQPYFRLMPEQYPVNFKIKALRDVRWKWSEIKDFLDFGSKSDQDLEAEIEYREEELRSQGKTLIEIEKILDKEFPYEEYDKRIDGSFLWYDALGKRKGAADTIIKKFLEYLKIGN